MIRSLLLILAVYAVLVFAASGQTAPAVAPAAATQPTAPRYTVHVLADGTMRVFSPSPKPGESAYSPELLAVLEAAWRPATVTPPIAAPAVTPPATLPTTAPTPVPATLPTTAPATQPTPTTAPATQPLPPKPLPVAQPAVQPGQSWVAALRAAKAGQTVYLARGGTWTQSLTDSSLRLPPGVTLAAADGDGPQPRIRVPEGAALILYRAQNVTLRDIAFSAAKPTANGVQFWGCEGITLDRCDVSGFRIGVTSEAFGSKRSSNLQILDSALHDNWHPANGHSHGLFADKTDGILLSNSAFLRNGWREGSAVGSDQNHGAYITGSSTGLVVQHCRLEANSSHGLQARPGGLIERNAFVDNPIGLSFGLVNGAGVIVEGGVKGSIRKNVFVGSRLLAGQPRGWAIELSNTADADITDNVFADDSPPNPLTMQAAIKLDVCNLLPGNPQRGKAIGIGKLRITGNAVTWPCNPAGTGPLWQGVRADDLQVQPTWPAVDVAAIGATLR